MDRKEIITALIDKNGLGLEVGPSHDPVTPKSAGYNVHIVDHLSQQDLKKKYKGHGVNLENIEPVDFVWRGETLRDLLNTSQSYDWIIASHVIEHVPDLIKFMNDCKEILKPGGVISLAIPDQRYCFDCLRSTSSTGDVLQAYLDGRTRLTAGQIFDSFSFASQIEGSIAWNQKTVGKIDFLHADGFAALTLKNYIESNDYLDAHAWVFTPHSFRLIINDLTALGYLRMREESFTPTIGCEFFVAFRNEPPNLRLDRLAVAKQAKDEIRQTSFS